MYHGEARVEQRCGGHHSGTAGLRLKLTPEEGLWLPDHKVPCVLFCWAS
jgi:hypothetical protein